MSAEEMLVRQVYDALEAGDRDRLAATFAAGVSWPEQGHEATRYRPISLSRTRAGEVQVLCRQTLDGVSQRVLHGFQVRDGRVAELSVERADDITRFQGVDALLERLQRALDASDLDAIAACYAPNARFVDTFESGVVEGAEALHAHFAHILETIRLDLVLMDYVIEPDDRVRVRMQVVTRSPGGAVWQDGPATIWYRLESGLIVDQEVDDRALGRF